VNNAKLQSIFDVEATCGRPSFEELAKKQNIFSIFLALVLKKCYHIIIDLKKTHFGVDF